MNYPLQSLVIIAPIIFLVLMIVTPVIGVFAGWKRAAYWGGGTFFFFLVGMIVWKAAGTSIINPLMSLIGDLLKDLGVSPTSKLVASLASPFFFIIVMAVAELILLINYYAWFKRVAKIKQDIKLKKEIKAAKKAGKKMPKISGSAWTQMQFTTKGKAINMAAGGAGLALLMAPSTVTFTQAIMYATTSSTTRASNAFAAGLYASLEKTAGAFSWMSYYGNADTGKDFDSLFSTLALTNTQVTYIDPTTGEEKTDTALNALGAVTSQGLSDVVKEATSSTGTGTPAEQLSAVEKSVNALAANWNSLMEQASTSIIPVFQSENVTEMLEPIVKTIIGSQKLDATEVYEAYIAEDSIFKGIIDQMKDGYAKGESEIEVTIPGVGTATIDALESIPVSQQSFNNIKSAFMSAFDTSELLEAEIPEFESAFGDILSMVFYVA